MIDFDTVVEEAARKFHYQPASLREAVINYLPEALAREIARRVATGEVSKPFDAAEWPTPDELERQAA